MEGSVQEETDRLPKGAWSRGWGETQGQEGGLQRVDKGGQEPLSLGGRGHEAPPLPAVALATARGLRA